MSTENTVTTAEKDFATAPNATLDELVGTTTNTAPIRRNGHRQRRPSDSRRT